VEAMSGFCFFFEFVVVVVSQSKSDPIDGDGYDETRVLLFLPTTNTITNDPHTHRNTKSLITAMMPSLLGLVGLA
jgi:hypothetical protein